MALLIPFLLVCVVVGVAGTWLHALVMDEE
jgi:hypothetical protein